jgi:hypothetical protein
LHQVRVDRLIYIIRSLSLYQDLTQLCTSWFRTVETQNYYRSSDIYTNELPEGHPILVTFTVGSYEMKENSGRSLPSKYTSPKKTMDEGFSKAISFNLQEVVLLMGIQEVVEKPISSC